MEDASHIEPPRERLVRATYRLQFHRGFTLRDALALVPYWRDLGVSHIYASPLLKACPGSTHGYDVCDPAQLNPEIGSPADLEALVTALHECDMGLVLDIVPNHMGICGRDNPWWWDVLKLGPNSAFANHFDIHWNSSDPTLRGKVLLPVLGADFDQVLASHEFQITREAGEFVVRYYDHQFPIDPASLAPFGPPPQDLVNELNSDRRRLGKLLQRQHYRLAHWRTADTDINYRRFFTVSSLAGLRVEEPRVFDHSHRRILEWHRQHWIDGLRVDHPDGLRDPEAYLRRLCQAAPSAWIVVEKILEPGETLPATWPVAGTTGYDFIDQLSRLFLDSAAEEPLTEFYASFTGEPVDYPAFVRDKKRWMLEHHFVAEVCQLTELARALALDRGRSAAFLPDRLREAIEELIACFPVYRTYARAPEGELSSRDVKYIEQAAAQARQHRPDLGPHLFFLSDLLLLRVKSRGAAEFVMRFQQLTGPAMAKGVEDTAFYGFNRFIALNEVGADPSHFGDGPEDFHRFCYRTRQHWPHTMLATSTHDTKRSEDVRARLAVLSEMPEAWAAAVRRWSSLAEPFHRDGWPDRNIEYHFYQTLVGAWPLAPDRACAYMEKAAREAKQHTTWTDPNPAYESALRDFVKAVLSDAALIRDLGEFAAGLRLPGFLNSLSQTLLKLTAPGVPDIYQGTDLWDFSLVDPDNRRPVDFANRARALEALRERLAKRAGPDLARELFAAPEDGRVKLFLVHQVLDFRRRCPELFREGQYVPLLATGHLSRHVCAFARVLDDAMSITVVPRLLLSLCAAGPCRPMGPGIWKATGLLLPLLPPGRALRNVLTGASLGEIPGGPNSPLPVADVLAEFPVALLERVN